MLTGHEFSELPDACSLVSLSLQTTISIMFLEDAGTTFKCLWIVRIFISKYMSI